MGGQSFAVVVLLAVACNVITGVGDLKVAAENCGADAGDPCDAQTSTTGELLPDEPPPGTSGSGGDFASEDAGISGGGSDGCAAARDIQAIFNPNISGRSSRDGCGPAGDISTGGSGAGGALDPPGGASGAGGAEDPPLPSSNCAPGKVLACTGPGDCAGVQTCLADGSAYASCECDPAPTGVRGAVAATCTGDVDCAAGLSCTTPGDIGGAFSAGAEPGGPQNGYCSRSCNTDADGQAVDPLAICLGPGAGQNHCFESCDVLRPSFPAQCNGRDDLTCIPISSGATLLAYCAPACHDDAGCAPRVCNLGTGLCQDQRPSGDPLGAACVSDAECASGVCFALRGQPSICTGLCTFGSTGGCGFAKGASTHDAACLDTVAGDGLGPGLCTELCDRDSDCEQQQAGWGCTPWSLDVVLERALDFNSIGFCERSAGGSSVTNGSGCSEECLYASDGECDDGSPGSSTDLCLPGTDCVDCGAR